MPEGPLGGPRPFVDSDETGPLGVKRPLANSVESCMDSIEAQKFVDNYEEERGVPLSLEEKKDMKRAWCEGVVGKNWREDWFIGFREAIIGE